MSSPWQEEVAKTREMAKKYRKVLDETFGTQVEVIEDIEASDKMGVGVDPEGQEGQQDGPSSSMKKRAVSAKSHIFRKGKIEHKYVLYSTKETFRYDYRILSQKP